MAITQEKKKELINQFKRNKNDTGSPEVQISILTTRINEVSSHLTNNPKDYGSNKGLLTMVSKRKRLLNYLEKKDPGRLSKITDQLAIRG